MKVSSQLFLCDLRGKELLLKYSLGNILQTLMIAILNITFLLVFKIIVPVYNVEKYIDKCVRSLLKQDYGNIEVILVDDGSPDKSGYAPDNDRAHSRTPSAWSVYQDGC